MIKGMYSRWYRFDTNNVKYIKRFPVDTIPNPLIEDGYTEWNRGTGPHSEMALTKLRNSHKKYRGVPKSDETREKMRQAKLGVPKTEDHKLNMKLSHQRRRLQRTNDGTSKKELQREPYTN
jgi:hypothetical protein